MLAAARIYGDIARKVAQRGAHAWDARVTTSKREKLGHVLAALREIDFTRLVCVELSRESYRAHTMIPDALQYLRRIEAVQTEPRSA